MGLSRFYNVYKKYKKRRFSLLICSKCKKEFHDNYFYYKCDCGGNFKYKFTGALEFSKNNIVTSDRTIWRYFNYLPVRKKYIISLGEGLTPLIKLFWLNHDIYFKLDYLCPTGSFKDRGMSVLVSKLKEIGIDKIIEDSSGNAGASIAAYCANAKIDCTIFVPESTSYGKIVQMEIYGAKIKRIPGKREKSYLEAKKAAKSIYYASHNWSPYFLEGVKTVYYELWEQFKEKAPDNIIIPVGQGSLVLGFELAFRHLKKANLIGKLPKIFAIQAKNCSPFYHAYINKLEKPISTKEEKTIAEGISSTRIIRGEEVLRIIRESKGKVVAVSEEDILEGLKMAAQKGLYIEPTSATAIAGLNKLIKNEEINPKEKTIVILTGIGLKATDKIEKLLKVK